MKRSHSMNYKHSMTINKKAMKKKGKKMKKRKGDVTYRLYFWLLRISLKYLCLWHRILFFFILLSSMDWWWEENIDQKRMFATAFSIIHKFLRSKAVNASSDFFFISSFSIPFSHFWFLYNKQCVGFVHYHLIGDLVGCLCVEKIWKKKWFWASSNSWDCNSEKTSWISMIERKRKRLSP